MANTEDQAESNALSSSGSFSAMRKCQFNGEPDGLGQCSSAHCSKGKLKPNSNLSSFQIQQVATRLLTSSTSDFVEIFLSARRFESRQGICVV